MEEFEKKLIGLSKPEVSDLKHQKMLAEHIIHQKRKTALTWWWAFIPLYVIVALIMKSLYFPGHDLSSDLREFISVNQVLSVIIFGLLPGLTILLNFAGIKNIYFYSGANRLTTSLIRSFLFPVLLIVISIVVIMVYALLLFI